MDSRPPWLQLFEALLRQAGDKIDFIAAALALTDDDQTHLATLREVAADVARGRYDDVHMRLLAVASSSSSDLRQVARLLYITAPLETEEVLASEAAALSGLRVLFQDVRAAEFKRGSCAGFITACFGALLVLGSRHAMLKVEQIEDEIGQIFSHLLIQPKTYVEPHALSVICMLVLNTCKGSHLRELAQRVITLYGCETDSRKLMKRYYLPGISDD